MSDRGYRPKRLKAVIQAAEAAGWTYDRTRRDHPRLSPPRGQRAPDGSLQAPVCFASSPSDIRGDKNSLAALRRAGVDI